MAGQLSELERLQPQSKFWEPAGEALLAANLLALPVGHPYLHNHIQVSVSLEPRLLKLVDVAELAALRAAAEAELEGGWGTPFTLIQAWGRIP